MRSPLGKALLSSPDVSNSKLDPTGHGAAAWPRQGSRGHRHLWSLLCGSLPRSLSLSLPLSLCLSLSLSFSLWVSPSLFAFLSVYICSKKFGLTCNAKYVKKRRREAERHFGKAPGVPNSSLETVCEHLPSATSICLLLPQCCRWPLGDVKARLRRTFAQRAASSRRAAAAGSPVASRHRRHSCNSSSLTIPATPKLMPNWQSLSKIEALVQV